MGLFLFAITRETSLGTKQILCDGSTKRRETKEGKLQHVTSWFCFYVP
jgi:hypothetical protein